MGQYMEDAKSLLEKAAKDAEWDGPTVHEVLIDYIDSLNDPDRFQAFLEQQVSKEAAGSSN